MAVNRSRTADEIIVQHRMNIDEKRKRKGKYKLGKMMEIVSRIHVEKKREREKGGSGSTLRCQEARVFRASPPARDQRVFSRV